MRAIAFHAPFDLRFESAPDPRLEAPGDVLLRVDLCAICGSDLHVYRGVERGLESGTVMGHEFLGTVLEVGSEVTRWRPGDRVVSPFSTSCGDCFYCRTRLPSRCTRGQLFGWIEAGRGLHGGQAELVRVPLADATLVSLPAAIPEEAALLAGDVLSTGLHCAESGGVRPGDLVCVLGCGPVGLAAVIGARALGAERVVAIDSVGERLELAQRYGAVPIELGAPDRDHRVRALGGERGADVVLEAVGSPQASALAYALVRPGGTISAAGVHNEPTFAITPGQIYDKNLTYRAGRAPVRAYMDRVLARLATGEIDVAPLFSHRMALADAPRGYALFEEKREGCTKVLLRP